MEVEMLVALTSGRRQEITMELNTTHARLREDPPSEALVDLIEKNAAALKLENARIYYKFPLYKESDDVVAAKIIIVSPQHGVFVIETSNIRKAADQPALLRVDEELDVVFGQLHSRLTKHKTLRKDKKTLKFNLEPLIFAPNLEDFFADLELETEVVSDRASLRAYLEPYEIDKLDDDLIAEICSVLEGAKGLIVPRPRDVGALHEGSRASKVNKLESEIASFDQDQKHGYMEVFEGPQRIRGLAGSGKTVVLAMKAALTHLRDPDATIVYTFYTRSLYQHVKRLITRFYRQYDDRDPDWEKLHIMHAWGGRGRAGVYYEACKANGVAPLTYSDVSSELNPFDTVCTTLQQQVEVKAAYDYMFVDEGQDFPASFLRLCLSLARGNKFVYAYDELQISFKPRSRQSKVYLELALSLKKTSYLGNATETRAKFWSQPTVSALGSMAISYKCWRMQSTGVTSATKSKGNSPKAPKLRSSGPPRTRPVLFLNNQPSMKSSIL